MNGDHLVINHGVRIPVAELEFATSRSGGPGGQNVNKVETRVEVVFDVGSSPSLSNEQKALVQENLKSRLDGAGRIHVVAQESRSQWQNKQLAMEKLAKLLRFALTPRRKRVKTKATRQSKERRIQKKKRASEKKKMRKVRDLHEE